MSDALNPAVEFHVVNTLGWNDLRPLQRAAIGPIRGGEDCLLLAPTAGGKTEAAFFPVLSRMVEETWTGLSVLYVTPLRALLNNLQPRLESYGAWVGRTVGLWHGDVPDAERRRLLADRPDVLLTTPESLESMLVSRRVDHRSLFATVRAVVVDELHAFAGDDRGWHLLAVLERIEWLAGRRLQRIGLSATVGNPEQMLRWLQGGRGSERPGRVVAEDAAHASAPEIVLDYVGSTENAAEVISRLHGGEKRLVFCEARRQAEELAFELRRRAVTAYVSHSSLSADERRRSERAFAEDRDCVIVATSTLELGVDIGDLDRVIQVDAPTTVASFLQRLGRTGRRAGAVRNTTFLATEPPHLLRAAGLLMLWGQGYVEPVLPPPHPRHIVAQQLLALALQEGRMGSRTWPEWWGGLPVMEESGVVQRHLVSAGFLADDGGMLHIGGAAEREFGHRYFMDLLSSFTSAWEMRVVAGDRLVGTVSPMAVTTARQGDEPRILLAGRAWRVQSVDWDRHEILVQEQPEKGKVRWPSEPIAESFALCRAQRDVLLGMSPPGKVSRRAQQRLELLRVELADVVDRAGVVRVDRPAGSELWTWAGWKANETLIAALGADATSDNYRIVFANAEDALAPRLRGADVEAARPAVSPEAVAGLKFSAALPPELAAATLGERNADRAGATDVVRQQLVVRGTGGTSRSD